MIRGNISKEMEKVYTKMKEIESKTNKAIQDSVLDAHELSNQYAPKDTGKLRENSFTILNNSEVIGKGEANGIQRYSGDRDLGEVWTIGIMYTMPYAYIQHENPSKIFKNYTTPGTGDKYLFRAVNYELTTAKINKRVKEKIGNNK